MVDRTRRLLLRRSAAGALVAPLAGFLAACGGKSGWPEGMVEIKWDRDVCARCSMVISNRRFAAQIRGGPHNEAFKFDDVGCLAFWLRDKARELPWLAEAATRLWVADHGSKPEALAWLAPTSWLRRAALRLHREGGLPLLTVHPWELVDRPCPGDLSGLARLFHDAGRRGFLARLAPLLAGHRWSTLWEAIGGAPPGSGASLAEGGER